MVFTTISITPDLFQQINRIKHIGESFESFLRRLLAANGKQTTVPRYEKNWIELENFMERTGMEEGKTCPIEVIGEPYAGKSYIVKQLIKHYTARRFFIIDVADEYDTLPKVQTFWEALTLGKSCRYVPDSSAIETLINIQVVLPVRQNRSALKDWVIICEEAGAYKSLNFFGNESRKFVKCILVSPNAVWGDNDTIPKLKVIPEYIPRNRRGRKKT